jgi:Rrf2 family protein
MLISTKGRYAVQVMIDLAQHREEGYISLKMVAKRQDISMKYLEAIVGQLVKADLVLSTRGKDGGYKLQKSPEFYTLAAIIQAAEGSESSFSSTSCNQDGCLKSEKCLTMPVWKKLDQIIEEYLESVTLADLLDRNKI